MKTLPPVRPSAALRELVQASLEREVEAMHKSMVYWITAAWRANQPATVANDASPVWALQRALRKRGRYWRRKFEEQAAKIAEELTGRSRRYVDRALQKMLRDQGVTITFRMTRAMSQVVQASLEEQVRLITNLAEEHIAQVEGYVMRAIQTGRDLQRLTEDLEHGLGVTKRRAVTIARSQTNMTTATMVRTRGMELGCTEGQWLHSAGGKKPRPEHVAFSGKRYELAKGAFLEGKWTHPGVEPNCRCVSRLVLPGIGA